jgi:hypothetical protein
MPNDQTARRKEGSQPQRWVNRARLALVVHAACVLVLPSCASDKKTKTDYTDLNMGQRVVKQTKDPYSIKSPFQKDVFKASETVKTSGYKTGEYSGKKKGFFGRKDKFKAGSFAQADKSSQTGSKTFSGADEKSNLGGSTYKTPESRYGTQMNRSAGQASSFADDKYDSRGNPAALERTSNVKRPLILRGDAGYSEDEVKKLLNKS